MKLHIYDISDWSGIYINGRLVYEGHSIDPHRLLSLIDDHINFSWNIKYDEELELAMYKFRESRLPKYETGIEQLKEEAKA